MPKADALGDISTIDPAGFDPPTDANAGHLPTGRESNAKSSQPEIPTTHIGEGLPPVPAKLTAKILRHEFMEMHELLPEFWNEPKEDNRPATRAKVKKRVLYITVWLQCFACTWGTGPQVSNGGPGADGVHDCD